MQTKPGEHKSPVVLGAEENAQMQVTGAVVSKATTQGVVDADAMTGKFTLKREETRATRPSIWPAPSGFR